MTAPAALRAYRDAIRRALLDIRSLAGHRAYRRFVIVGVARTGSTLLLNLLNSHGQALAFGEIFRSPDRIGWDIAPFIGRSDESRLSQYQADPIRFLDDHVYRRWPRPIRAVGFKLFYYHARRPPFAHVWEHLEADRGIAVIHIKRRNILEQYLSLRLAHMTDIWSTARAPDQRPPPIRLDIDDCARHFAEVRAQEADTDRFFAGHPLRSIDYEDLAADRPGMMADIQDFLGLRPEPVRAQIVRQRQIPLDRAIENYNALRTAFAGSEWAGFFTEADANIDKAMAVRGTD